MGPHLGISPSIQLGQGFSLVADVAASSLVGKFKVKQREVWLDNLRYSDNFTKTRFLWELDLSGAISWQKELLYKILLVGASAGWEWHKFYGVNKLEQNNLHLLEKNANLIVRGVFVSLLIGF